MSLTRKLASFVAELSPNKIPEEAMRIARMGFIDCVGVMIAGREEPAPRILREVLDPAEGEATLYFSTARAPAPEAAWINGVAAHALDFDDVALRGHPSAVLVPAILAEAEVQDASGAEMLVAYVAGYEVWADLVRRDSGYHHGKGWHPTGIFGAVAAAASCARLRRLSADKTAQALALGASQSAGLMANFGTMTKPFHAGKSAHAGLMAARLADAGFTASGDALEHPQGFLSAVSPAGDVDRVSLPLMADEVWQIVKQGLSIKKYPTCYCTHRAIDGMLELMAERRVRAEEVGQITVTLSENYATILRNHAPETGLAAKFSIEFAMASAIVANRVGLTELTDGFVQRPDVRAVMGKVGVASNTEYDPGMPGAALFDQVQIVLADGHTVNGPEVRRARGHAARPLNATDLFDKFENCLEAGKTGIPAGVLFARLQQMQGLSARQLTAMP